MLFVIDLTAAVAGIAEVARNDVDAGPAGSLRTNLSLNLSEGAVRMTIPLIAGLSLAIGGPLIGMSVQPEEPTHEPEARRQVNPEGFHKVKHV